MERLLNVLTAASLLLIISVLVSVRRAHIRVEYSVSWLTAGVVLLIVSRNSGLLYWLSDLLGIAYPPIAMLLIIFSIFFFVFYRFSIRISDLKDANIALAQRVAILEFQVQSSHEKQPSPISS